MASGEEKSEVLAAKPELDARVAYGEREKERVRLLATLGGIMEELAGLELTEKHVREERFEGRPWDGDRGDDNFANFGQATVVTQDRSHGVRGNCLSSAGKMEWDVRLSGAGANNNCLHLSVELHGFYDDFERLPGHKPIGESAAERDYKRRFEKMERSSWEY